MNLDALLRIKADVQGENNIRRLGNSMQGLQGQAKNAALGFSNLKSAVAGFGAAIAGSAIVGGLSAMIKKSVDLGDELGKMSARTGVAQNALIGLRNAAALSDVSNETLGKSLTKLNVNLVKAAEGNEDLARNFQRLGVDIKGADGQVVSADKALKQIADRFADMPDGAQKAAAAVAIFGKSGADLIPLLNSGSEAMDKFIFKVSDEFSGRSERFNDTITELGFKTQGFGLQLTDALLPALQEILDVFAELFDTESDWTGLFKTIEALIRGFAIAVYTVIKAVDILIKNVVAAVQAAQQALTGDFLGAWNTVTNRISGTGADVKEALDGLNRLAFGRAEAASGSVGSGRDRLGLDMTDLNERAAAEAAKREAAAKRAASEAERLEQRRQALGQQALDLQEQLRRSVEDVNAAYAGVGLTPVGELQQQRNDAITENNRQVDDLTRKVVQLVRDVNAAGGEIDVKPFEELINTLSAGNVALADKAFTQGLIDLLPNLQEYDDRIAEVARGKTELTEVEKLNAQINLLQLDILAQTNPALAEQIKALAEQIKLLRERAKALDDATAAQDKNSKSFGTQFKESFKQASDSATNLGANLAGIATNGIGGLTNAIVEFAATGKAAFKEFAASVLKDLGAMLIKFAIFKAVSGIFPGLSVGVAATGGSTGPDSSAPLKKFATGGVMSNNVVPMRRYASGGIARSPEMAIYGERGPEAYVPLPDGRSIPVKLRTDALNRYRPAGAMGGAAADGGEGGDGMSAPRGGGAIDVRYESTVINNVEYVTAEQFRAGIQRAATEGAQRGTQNTLKRLQQSPATRRKVGI